ncbi:MAG TPA: DUF2141 domain-containing protein [Allosphingosinicella sp.]|jgi:uncharacterized protein (DUF2141 family)|uniref:DUF2141 domain-containing protein n=1 Tax=Allosphingosinicella sp. TaxID=2823234 RepID=UPI002F2956AE
MRIVLVLLSLFLASAPATASELKFQLSGLKPRGQVMVLLFNAERTWKAKVGAVREIRLRVGAAAAEIGFEGLKAGTYGAMVFQDLNMDGKMNFNSVGFPLEPYGFSNNSRGMFGPPSWSKASFRFGGQPVVQAIRLK